MRLWQRGRKAIWWADFTVAGLRVTRSSGTADRTQAQEWAARLAADIWRQRRLGEKPRVTWGAAVLQWLREHGESRRSIEDMKDRLRFLSQHLEHAALQDITPDRVDAILSDRGAPGTRNRYVAEASKILNYARRQGWIDAAPALRRYKETPGDPRWLTSEQASALIGELPEHLADMARFALATGLRESNVRLLRWRQVDTVRAAAWVLSSQSKNGRALSVPLNADALEVLAQRRGEHAVYVFTYLHRDEKRWPVWNCSSHAWYKAVARAGLKGLRWHDLRHTWATWHLMAGTPPQVLQALGGWSSQSMVARYAHVAPGFAARYADGSLRDKSAAISAERMGWLMGLEPTTTGITRGQSSGKLLNLNDALARKRRKTA